MKEDTKKKQNILRKNNMVIKQDHVIKRAKRMQRVEDIIFCSSPFVLALIIQLVSSFAGMFIYGMVMEVQRIPDKRLSQIDFGEIINTSLTMEASLIISAFSAIICIVVFLIWYMKQIKIDNSSITLNRMKLKHILLVVLLGVGLQIGSSYILNFIAILKPSWFYNYGLMMEQLGSGTSIVSFIYIVIIAPISEELIFRGVLFNKAKKVLPFFLANVLQAFLFGLYHMNIIQGVYAFIIGMFLGSICYGFNSIYPSIILHVIINLCGLLLGQINMEEQYQTHLVFSIIIIVSIIGVVISMLMLKKDYVLIEDEMVNDEGTSKKK